MLYQDGKGIMETSTENASNKEDAAKYRALKQDMKQQEAVDMGMLEGKNQLLQEIQAMADAEAAYNNVPMSQSPYAVNARMGQEEPSPSYRDSIKSALNRLFGNNDVRSEPGLAIAASEQAEYQRQQDMAAQEADRLKYYSKEVQ